jgi:hypothetical protein
VYFNGSSGFRIVPSPPVNVMSRHDVPASVDAGGGADDGVLAWAVAALLGVEADTGRTTPSLATAKITLVVLDGQHRASVAAYRAYSAVSRAAL